METGDGPHLLNRPCPLSDTKYRDIADGNRAKSPQVKKTINGSDTKYRDIADGNN